MTGIDTNVLVALINANHPVHSAALELFEAEILSGDAILALTPAVIAEFVHVVTDARRFEHPLTIAQALADARFWWTSTQTCQVFPTSESVELFYNWMQTHRLGRKRALDTMLAASLQTVGARRLTTSNPDDFRVFGVFELLVP